jgi:hypothetical protein
VNGDTPQTQPRETPNAVSTVSRVPRARITVGAPALSGLAILAISAALVGMLLSGATSGAGFFGAASGTATSISRDEAITIARQSVPADAVLQTASSGLLSDLIPSGQDRRLNPSAIAADRAVWAVEFEIQLKICRPDGSGCLQPRVGWRTVYLDYVTGAFLEATTYSPPTASPTSSQAG